MLALYFCSLSSIFRVRELTLSTTIQTSEDNRGLSDAVNVANDAYISIKRDELDQIRPFLIEKAANWSKAALEIDETDFVWHVRLGETYRGCQQPEKAAEEYGKVRLFIIEFL